MSRRRRVKLVRYSSPFGSPAHMERERAQALLREDDHTYCWLQAVGSLSKEQKAHGPPRIDA